MLRFTLTNNNAHTGIIGTTNPEHLNMNIESALKGPMEVDLYNQVRKRIDSNPTI